jgi:transposase
MKVQNNFRNEGIENMYRNGISTICKIAQKSNVSIPTVYQVLNQRCPNETLWKVWKTQRKLNKRLINRQNPTLRKHTTFSSSFRKIVWKTYAGKTYQSKCYSCGLDINIDDSWHISHIVSRYHNGKDTLENVRPCCAACNIACGTQNLITYVRQNNFQLSPLFY